MATHQEYRKTFNPSESGPSPAQKYIKLAKVPLGAVASGRADSPVTHLALEGALRWAHQLYEEAGTLWVAAAGDEAATRWQRDAALFAVAGSARAQRAARAWERLSQTGDLHG